MTVYSRKQLGTALELAILANEEITATYKIVTDPRELGELDPAADAYLQLVRQRIEPAAQSPRGQLRESHDVWLVLVAKLDDEEVEDSLDDRLEEVLGILDGLDWLVFLAAERQTHTSQQPAYKITVTLTTEKP